MGSIAEGTGGIRKNAKQGAAEGFIAEVFPKPVFFLFDYF